MNMNNSLPAPAPSTWRLEAHQLLQAGRPRHPDPEGGYRQLLQPGLRHHGPEDRHEAYYRYSKSFGLMETTGIDLPAEAEGILL